MRVVATVAARDAGCQIEWLWRPTAIREPEAGPRHDVAVRVEDFPITADDSAAPWKAPSSGAIVWRATTLQQGFRRRRDTSPVTWEDEMRRVARCLSASL